MIINYSLQSLLNYEHCIIDLIYSQCFVYMWGDMGRELSLVHLWVIIFVKQFLYLAEDMGPQHNSQVKVSVCLH